MQYPMKQYYDPILGEVCREMFPDEYEEAIQWFKNYIKRNESDKCRREQEYISYLKRWFGSGPCDGLPNFKARHALHKLPMSFNIYFN